jgi:MraZ protein
VVNIRTKILRAQYALKIYHPKIFMFIGEYLHSIDLKKRMAVPSKFRADLKNKVVVTRGLDKCLFVYPMKVWEDLAGKLGTLPVGESATRSFIRLMLAGAVDVDVDKQGRILIPDYLKEYAGLGKNVVVAGIYNRLEIWDEKKWKDYKKKAEKNTDEIAEQLGKLGVY